MALFSLTPSALLGTLSAVISARIIWEYLFSPLRAFPGPFVSKLTDAWRAYIVTLGDADKRHLAWHRRWGSAVRVGPNTISLNDPDLIKVVYGGRSSWRKSNMYRPNDAMMDGVRIDNLFNTQDEERHAKYKKPIASMWTLPKILELEPLIDETLRELVQKLNQEFVEPGAVCMMDDWASYYTWDATSNVSFGKEYGLIQAGRDVEGIIAESTSGLKYFAPVSQMPWLDDWLDKNPWYRIGPRPLVNGVLYTMRIVSEYQQEVAAGAASSARRREQDLFLDKYNALKDRYDFIDDQQVTKYLMANVLAGGDSTSGTVRAVFYHLSKNPERRGRLRDELDEARLSFPARWEDAVRLPYLDACMKESLRLCPGIGLMLEREVPESGLTLPDGRFVPGGTVVGLNPAVVTRDEGRFGGRVDEFLPERWLPRDGEDGEDGEEFARRNRRMQEVVDFTFGAGGRICMGRHLAKVEMYKLVASLYSIYDIQLKDPEHEWKYCNSWFMYHSDIPLVLKPRVDI